MGKLALAVAVLAAKFVPSEGYSFNARPSAAAPGQQSHRREQKCGLRLKSAATTQTPSTQDDSTTTGQSTLLRPDSWPASKRRRVKGAIKRRARRLARVRKKNKARQDSLELNDVADISKSTYFPLRRGGRAAGGAGAAAAAKGDEEAKEEAPSAAAGAAQSPMEREGGSSESSVVTGTAATAGPAPTAAKRRKKHATIKGRPIVKGGKGRGLWRSIFGPRPLLEVHSVDQLSQLVDVEGWGLEDLSVLTSGARAAESATSAAIAAAVAMDIEGVAKAAASATATQSGEDILAAADNGGRGVGLDQGEGTATAAATAEDLGAGVYDGAPGDDDGAVLAEGESSAPSLPRQQQQQPPLHPAVQAVLKRAAAGTSPSLHGDGRRIGLAIEGGGMRGCVAAGMASCLHFLGLADSFDCVYGASAGSLIGAYFVSRQSNGTAVYHDILPSAGSRFIDMAKFPQALGFELPKVPKKSGGGGGGEELSALKAARAASFARVIGLDFLLGDVVGRVHALDFEAFNANDKLQPLHVVASGVSSMSTVSLASRRGHFSTLDELTGCIRASMLVPGLAGPLLSVPRRQRAGSGAGSEAGRPWAAEKPQRRKDGFVFRRRGGGEEEQRRRLELEGEDSAATTPLDLGSESGSSEEGEIADGDDATELLVDAMVFEPLPYRSAIEDGCTDVVVLCTRPKGSQVLGKKPSIYESRVVKKFFEQHDDPAATSEISDYLQELRHLRIYAEDALVLAEGSRTGAPQSAPKGGPGEGREAFMMAIAPDASCKEVGQLEMDRRVILQGCRDGFAACYDTFVGGAKSLWALEDGEEEQEGKGEGGLDEAGSTSSAGGNEGGSEGDNVADVVGLATRSGAEVAQEYFPDSLLSIPADLNATYFESGYFISDRQQQPQQSPLAQAANGDGGGASVAGRGAAMAAMGRRFAPGAARGSGSELERLLLNRNGDGGAAAADAAAAAVMEGVGRSSAVLELPPSSGRRRGMLRRLLSRAKLRRSLQATSRAAIAATPAADPLVAGDGVCETVSAGTASDSML